MGYLHMHLSEGRLTSWEKTKLCRAYAFSKFEHITFFKHIAHEIIAEFEINRLKRSTGQNVIKKIIDKESKKNDFHGQRDNNLDKISEDQLDREALENSFLKQNFNESDSKSDKIEIIYEFLSTEYEFGFGRSDQFGQSGIKVNVMPVVWNKKNDLQNEVFEQNYVEDHQDIVNDLPSETKKNSLTDFSCGQIAVIVDSMIYLGINRVAKYFPKLIDVMLHYTKDKNVIEKFDPLQITSCMIFYSQCERNIKHDEVIRHLTTRMLQLFFMDVAKPGQLSLFLKELVYFIGNDKSKKNSRDKTLRWKEYRRLEWLFNSKGLQDSDETSLIQQLCGHICSRVYLFPICDLASCLRSISYIGFNDHSFYRIFDNYFMERSEEIGCLDIKNITEAFNKQKIDNRQLFYQLGKRFQHLQEERGIKKGVNKVVKRIG